jgi:hypothetical protein
MQRYKHFTEKKNLEVIKITQKLTTKKRVDVNILLNRVKLNEKIKKKENLIILFSTIILVGFTAVFTIF